MVILLRADRDAWDRDEARRSGMIQCLEISRLGRRNICGERHPPGADKACTQVSD
jgi:hypothetical protein